MKGGAVAAAMIGMPLRGVARMVGVDASGGPNPTGGAPAGGIDDGDEVAWMGSRHGIREGIEAARPLHIVNILTEEDVESGDHESRITGSRREMGRVFDFMAPGKLSDE